MKWAYHFKKNNWQSLPVGKNWRFQGHLTLRILENLLCAAVSLVAFPVFEDFPDEINGDISKSDFFLILYNEKSVNI